MKLTKLLLVALLIVVTLSACGTGGGTSVDLNKTMETIKEEVKTMDVEQLKKTASKYVAEIEKYNPKVKELTEKIKQIPLAQLMGDEAKGYKAEIEVIAKDIKALTERLEIYNNKLKEYGVDISQYMPKKS